MLDEAIAEDSSAPFGLELAADPETFGLAVYFKISTNDVNFR